MQWKVEGTWSMKCTGGVEYARVYEGRQRILFWHLFDGSQDSALVLINSVLGSHQGPFTVAVRSDSKVTTDS